MKFTPKSFGFFTACRNNDYISAKKHLDTYSRVVISKCFRAAVTRYDETAIKFINRSRYEPNLIGTTLKCQEYRKGMFKRCKLKFILSLMKQDEFRIDGNSFESFLNNQGYTLDSFDEIFDLMIPLITQSDLQHCLRRHASIISPHKITLKILEHVSDEGIKNMHDWFLEIYDRINIFVLKAFLKRTDIRRELSIHNNIGALFYRNISNLSTTRFLVSYGIDITPKCFEHFHRSYTHLGIEFLCAHCSPNFDDIVCSPKCNEYNCDIYRFYQSDTLTRKRRAEYEELVLSKYIISDLTSIVTDYCFDVFVRYGMHGE